MKDAHDVYSAASEGLRVFLLVAGPLLLGAVAGGGVAAALRWLLTVDDRSAAYAARLVGTGVVLAVLFGPFREAFLRLAAEALG